MTTDFSLDLRVARRKAGFIQRDAAHLLGISPRRMSRLEHGRSLPTLEQAITLYLIYDRTFETLYTMLMATAREKLRARFGHMPEGVRRWAGTFNRDHSLESLGRRLAETKSADDGAG